MPDYKYTGAYPVAFPLELGADAEVTPAEGNPSIGPTGSTVYLYPKDVLHTKVPIVHAWLQEIEATPTKATKPAVEPVAVTPAGTTDTAPVESSTPTPESPADSGTEPTEPKEETK